jgi:hypothetical protein
VCGNPSEESQHRTEDGGNQRRHTDRGGPQVRNDSEPDEYHAKRRRYTCHDLSSLSPGAQRGDARLERGCVEKNTSPPPAIDLQRCQHLMLCLNHADE